MNISSLKTRVSDDKFSEWYLLFGFGVLGDGFDDVFVIVEVLRGDGRPSLLSIFFTGVAATEQVFDHCAN